MGGLAPDSDEPMPAATQRYVRSAWDAVQAATGVQFNRDFWTECTPRRSTYPACRAVLAAAAQDPAAGEAMFHAIQRAYYLDARNPSDLSTLEAVSAGLSPTIDPVRFARDLRSEAIEQRLRDDLERVAELGVSSFPTLILAAGEMHVVSAGWSSLDACRARLEGLL